MDTSGRRIVKAVNTETIIFILISGGLMGYLSLTMGLANMFSTIMDTAHQLLLDTVFKIMAVAVLAGAIGGLLSEFGVIALINTIISPIMGPLYGMPGAAAIGAMTTYISDNPAIISLANDKGFKRFFKPYQIPALCNLGTAFGMGLILTTYMMSKGQLYFIPAILGNIGAIIGSIVSVRIMLHYTKKYYNNQQDSSSSDQQSVSMDIFKYREIREGSTFQRTLEALLEGGKNGVEMGLAIIPGVIFICTLVLILTFGPADPSVGYQGLAFEGVGLLPAIGRHLSVLLKPLFGFTNPEAIAFPVTSLGAVGAAMGLTDKFLQSGLIGPGEIAVFTAMGMCWSGYLSTHVGMMDALGVRNLTNKAILSHTIGGIVAGVSANYLYQLYRLLFM